MGGPENRAAAGTVDRRHLGDDWDDWDDEPDAEASAETSVASGLARRQLLASPLLLSSLEQAAAASNPQAHHLLASLLRCGRPNPYLYEESLKGWVLTATERGWVEGYLRLEPQYRKYEAHLKAAALGGVRAAALEYGKAFEAPEFIAIADRMTGEVDALEMARFAPSEESRERWPRTAAQQGSRSALEALAASGDAWAGRPGRRLGGQSLAARIRAWTWQYLALGRGADLTRSTMAAYHDGGERDGQFYDSDFGGPLYAAGDEGLELPAPDRTSHRADKAKARQFAERAR